jgi:elongation factor Tu
MIIGATQMEGVILVVSVPDGPQEQTREHIILSKEIGIKYLLVYGNKLDAVLEADIKDLMEIEIREELEKYGYPGSELPIIFGSARQALFEEEESEMGGKSISNLMKEVDTYIPQPQRPINEPFLMPIEDVFSITGRGTVLTGKVEKGTIKVGEDVDIIGFKKFTTTCTGLEMYHKILDMAQAGENVGVLVRGISKHDVKRGFVLAQPKSLEARDKFEAKAYILTKEEGGRHKPFQNNFKPQFFFRTSNVTGSITLLGEATIAMPGDTIIFEVHLLEKAALNENLRFAIREGTLTIGAGVITKLL